MPKTLIMERFTIIYIKIKFQNTKSQKLPRKKSDFFFNQNLKIFDIWLYKGEGSRYKPVRNDFLISLLTINKTKVYIIFLPFLYVVYILSIKPKSKPVKI